MKLLRHLIFLSMVLAIASCSVFKKVKTGNELAQGKVIAQSFPIDKERPHLAQRQLEEEQMRLRKLFPDLKLAGVIQPNSPWILITEDCMIKAEYEQVLKQISKECPDAKVVPCE